MTFAGRAYEIVGNLMPQLIWKLYSLHMQSHISQHVIFCIPDLSAITYVMGAQKNRLIEMVLLSTHDIYFAVIFDHTHQDAFMVFLQAPMSCECLFLGYKHSSQ